MRTLAKLPLMALSLALSMILWVYVEIQENPDKPLLPAYPVNVEARYYPDNVVVAPIDPIKVLPQGSAEERQRIDPQNLSAYVDLSHPITGPVPHSYPLHFVDKGDSMKWRVPAQVQVLVQNKLTKNVIVQIQTTGALRDTNYLFVASQSRVEPDMVSVSGPASDVDHVAYGRIVLDLATTVPGKSYSADVELFDEDGRVAPSTVSANPKTVTIKPMIAVGSDTRTVHVQPTYVGQPAVGYAVSDIQVTPEDVQIRGNPDLLSGTTFLRTEPVTLTGLKQTTVFTLTPELREGVSLTSAEPITVKVTISPTVPPPTPESKSPGTKKGRRRAAQ